MCGGELWKTLCEVWKTLCGGEGVKINSKIISKKFGGVECLFYFCSVQISERPINGLQSYRLKGCCRAPELENA